ncbi:MAG: hypothetical protein DI526_00615 [Caulobacter segnis]|uniref:Uncharacterized protein n=1 Tax=Caulobacter segnis TaxID=88688 RepID=A0A2W5VDS6_9CAUL|nr:MAG: hypothetical protein DI526_00615 [Caulobacter segnis]
MEGPCEAATSPPLRGPPPSRRVFASIHLPLMGRRDQSLNTPPGSPTGPPPDPPSRSPCRSRSCPRRCVSSWR